MDAKAILRRLWRHVEWADRSQRATMQTHGDAVPEEALRLYAHVVGAEDVWLGRIEGGKRETAVWPEWTLEECERRAVRLFESFHTLIARLDNDGLDRTVRYTNSSGTAFETPLGEILLHIPLHGAYHRGQISRILRDAGLDPPVTDFIAYIRNPHP